MQLHLLVIMEQILDPLLNKFLIKRIPSKMA